MREELLAHWFDLCARAGIKMIRPSYMLFHIEAKYGNRPYHNLGHIEEMLVASKGYVPHNPEALEFAIFFHDAIYDVRKIDNEERSAEYAAKNLAELRCDAEFISLVVQLILDTKHKTVPETGDGQLIASLDLLSFCKPYEEFMEDGKRIREEYMAANTDEEFTGGRIKFFERMLRREEIFYHVAFFRKEVMARQNLARAIEELRAKYHGKNRIGTNNDQMPGL